jgi:hypothetical protein
LTTQVLVLVLCLVVVDSVAVVVLRWVECAVLPVDVWVVVSTLVSSVLCFVESVLLSAPPRVVDAWLLSVGASLVSVSVARLDVDSPTPEPDELSVALPRGPSGPWGLEHATGAMAAPTMDKRPKRTREVSGLAGTARSDGAASFKE